MRSGKPLPAIFHSHLHVLAADGLFTPDGRFHCMPAEDLAPAILRFHKGSYEWQAIGNPTEAMKRFIVDSIRASFAGPLRRTVPAIF